LILSITSILSTFAAELKHTKVKNFEELGIQPDFVKGIKELNIITPTEIQSEVIPILLGGNTDLIGQAQTGTGKTAAYGLPLLHKVDPANKKVQGLILCPTRELAQQTAKQLFRFTKYSDKIFTEAVYGGAKIDNQIAALKRPTQIIVATPGRLVDLIKRKAVDLSKVSTVILDEADEMLSMGFKEELDEILSHLAKTKSKWLFSATMPQVLNQIISKHMSADAKKIVIGKSNVVNKNIEHQYVACSDNDKLNVLINFLRANEGNRGMIFCRTKANAQRTTKQLIAKNIAADALHGDLTQKERDKVMRAFKKDNLKLLVATDIAARGLDVDSLSFVVHYQMAEKKEYYTHRSGRTARAGKKGISLCLVNPIEIKQMKTFEKELGIKFLKKG